MKRITFFFLCFLILFGVPRPAFAMTVVVEDSVTLKEETVIEGNYAVTGSTITIDGTVNGDLLCAGQTIIIRGVINGDVLCVGQTITVEGPVDGNIRTIAQTLTVDADIARNVMALGQTITIGKNAIVGNELLIAGQQANIAGFVTNDVIGGFQTILIDGVIGGSVKLETESMTLGKEANIAGSLNYASSKKAMIDPQATIAGEVVYREVTRSEKKEFVRTPSKWQRTRGFVVDFIITLIFGLLFIIFLPRVVEKAQNMLEKTPWKSLGITVLTLCVFPIAFLLLCITLVGIPFALIFAMALFVLFFAGKLIVAYSIGCYVIRLLVKKSDVRPMVCMAAGIFVTTLLCVLPIIGGIMSMIVYMFGFGAMAQAVFIKAQIKNRGIAFKK